MSDKYLGEAVGKLGFGFMRLPENKDGSLDIEPMKKMVDTFLDAGFTYFDTAYVYRGSEEALREALVRRHPRDRFTIATKMPLFLVNKRRIWRRRSLRRFNAWASIIWTSTCFTASASPCATSSRASAAGSMSKKLKADGKIRHFGFSFHDTPENLDTILTRHPEAEFVQLQINYLDWDDPKVQSRRLYETARRHNKPFIIMEPVKGGLLAGDGSEAEKLLKKADPKASTASWAVRFAASLDGLFIMLSGMNTMEQLEDNITTIKNLTPLSGSELKTVREAVDIINSKPSIPCTACKYCVANCPQKLNIPFLIHIYNTYLIYNSKVGSGMPFSQATSGGRSPSTASAAARAKSTAPSTSKSQTRCAK